VAYLIKMKTNEPCKSVGLAQATYRGINVTEVRISGTALLVALH
jgi:hypothetical protein